VEKALARLRELPDAHRVQEKHYGQRNDGSGGDRNNLS
jgi:hypothetical protein